MSRGMKTAVAAAAAAALAPGGCGRGGEEQAAPAASSAQLARGAEVFEINCITCHGETGKGDGAVAATLKVKPRDLTSEPYKYVDVAGAKTEVDALVNYIRVGRPENGMPPFGFLPPEDLRAVAAHVASLRPEEPRADN